MFPFDVHFKILLNVGFVGAKWALIRLLARVGYGMAFKQVFSIHSVKPLKTANTFEERCR